MGKLVNLESTASAEQSQSDASFTAAKDACEFRNYEDSKRQEIVRTHYHDMRQNQCLEYVKRMHQKYSFADGKYRQKFSIREAFRRLEDYVDSSDPDM